MRNPVHSPCPPGYTDVMQAILIVLEVSGLFVDTPRYICHKYKKFLKLVSIFPILFKGQNTILLFK